MRILILIVIAYLLGFIPAGLWTGKPFYHANSREHGSGNTGTIDTFRILRPKAGMVAFIIDVLKGTVTTLLPHILGVTAVSPILAGLSAIIRHMFPIPAKSEGSKAVATSASVFLGFAPVFLPYLLIIFAGTSYLFSMISLSSVVTTAVVVVSVLISPAFGFLLPHYDLLFMLIIVLTVSIIIIRHKDNVTRIRKYGGNPVPWGLDLDKQKVGQKSQSTFFVTLNKQFYRHRWYI